MPHHIHALSEKHRADLTSHFKLLTPADRYLRFGTAINDAGIESYIASIDFKVSDVFVVFDDRLQIAGAVHLAHGTENAELGLSVLPQVRGQGIGNSLFARATSHLTNRFIRTVYMHCLRENDTIMHLARKNGMRIVVDGSEADAYLALPSASPETITAEWLAARLALMDYQMKVGANAAREVLEALAA